MSRISTSSGGLNPESLAVVRAFHAAQNRRVRKVGMASMVVRVDARGNIDSAPTKPGALQVLPTGDKAMTLLWKPASDDHRVRAYRVFRDGKPIGTVRGSTWFVDKGAAGQPHDYAVKAIDSAGLSGSASKALLRTLLLRQQGAAQAEQGAQGQAGQSATPAGQAAAGATIPAGTAPTVPTITSVKGTSKDAVAVTWAAIPAAVAYGIYQNGKLIGHTKDPAFAATITAGAPLVLQIDAVAADGTRSQQAPAIGLRLGANGVEAGQVRDESAGTAPSVAPESTGPPPAAPAETAPPAAPSAATPAAPPAATSAATPAATASAPPSDTPTAAS